MKLENSVPGDNINVNLLNIKYAVKGPIVQRAEQIQRELDNGVKKPFSRVIFAHVGDSHALGQRPLTFIRQVVAVCTHPALMTSPEFPDDVKKRASEIIADCKSGSIGAYSPALGLQGVRARAARYISRRDGSVACDVDDVILGAGASDLVKSVLSLFAGIGADGVPNGVMIPVPQYPLFSATLTELGVRQVPYELDEEDGWRVRWEALEGSWRGAGAECRVRALVVINPGNPTGQVMSVEDMKVVIKYAYERSLLILADEVYQENIVSKPFHSFKKIISQMGAPYNRVELASFMTASKGIAAECGARAGLCELVVERGQGAAAEAVGERGAEALRRARAVQHCPSVLGQAVLDCILQPPGPGEASFPHYARERAEIRRRLAQRSEAAVRGFNSIPGYHCNDIHGAMFAFPRVEIPARAQAVAHQQGLTPDEFYCLRLLEETGVCVVPGSGFGQRAGSFHFRSTLLHAAPEFRRMMHSFRDFHLGFIHQYAPTTLQTIDIKQR